jgi:hypothetical protein
VIPPVIFGGFHPDTCYVTRGDLRGPTNAIHSRIVIAGFLAGLGADDVAALYNRLVFARLGYFTSFAEQRALLEAAYAARGIELAPWFDAWLRQGCFMHSVNHPKVHVLFDIARIVCRQAGLTVDEAAACPEDDLAAMARHPVHRDLARAFGVAPEDRFYPPAPKGRQPAPMPLEQYIDRSFALYATARPSALRSVDGVREALRTLHEN